MIGLKRLYKQQKFLLHDAIKFSKNGILKAIYRFYIKNKISLMLNKNSGANIPDYLSHIDNNGYQVLSNLDNSIVNEVVDIFLQSLGGKYLNLNNYFESERGTGFVRANQIDLTNHTIVRKVLHKLKLYEIVSDYLNINYEKIFFNVVVDSLVKTDKERKFNGNYDDALEWHRDVDAEKFVKVFIYLNDIEEGCGHHEIYEKSHRYAPFSIRTIIRYSENELKAKLSQLSKKTIVGSAGFCWIENTTAFHRGTLPIKGDRLIMTLIFMDEYSAINMQPKDVYISLSDSLREMQ